MQQRIFTDLDLNFSKHPITKDVTKKTKENAIIGAVRNLLQTNYFERPFNPTLGSNINALLFEPADDVTAIAMAKEIRLLITNFEPRVKIDELQVNADPDNNRFEVTIRFYIINSVKPITISLFLQRLR